MQCRLLSVELIFVCELLFYFNAISANTLMNKMAEFMTNKGWQDIALVSSGEAIREKSSFHKSLAKISPAPKIRYLTTNSTCLFLRTEDNIQEEHVILLAHEDDDHLLLADIIRECKGYSLLLITRDLERIMSYFDVPLGFYCIDTSRRFLEVLKVTVSRAKATQGLKFHLTSDLDSTNMNGAHMAILTLTFKPYLSMPNCTPHHDCKGLYGIAQDTLSFAASEANFSYSVQVDPSGQWGVVPTAGESPNDAVGTIGNILSGKSDVAFSAWFATYERFHWLDFSLPYDDGEIKCYANAGMFKSGNFLFVLEPFPLESWFLVSAVLALVAFVWLVLQFLAKYVKLTWGLRFWTFWGGIACTVVGALYAGSQTTYLTTKPRFPFDSINDGLDGMPDWNVLLTSSQAEYQVRHLPLIHKKGFQHLPDNDVLNHLAKGKYFLLSEKRLVHEIINRRGRHIVEADKIVEFCKPVRRFITFLLPKNSPFKSAIDRSILKMHQMGTLQVIGKRWTGHVNSESLSKLDQLTQSITFNHIGLSFYCAIAVFAIILFVLAIEMVNSRKKFKKMSIR